MYDVVNPYQGQTIVIQNWDSTRAQAFITQNEKFENQIENYQWTVEYNGFLTEC